MERVRLTIQALHTPIRVRVRVRVRVNIYNFDMVHSTYSQNPKKAVIRSLLHTRKVCS